MAARSVRAFLHNDSDSPLIKISDGCPHGEWTTPAPDRIEAHSTATMRAASKLLGGVESRATYQIGDDHTSTLYIHWDNPTSGSNSYHTNTDAGHYAFWSAPTSGSDPVAHFILRPAGKVETDFLPSRDGFHFDNKWPNTPYSLPPLRGTLLDKKYGNAENGLCGGMVLGAFDYFVAGQEVPSTTTAPMGERDPLFLFLVNRIFDTFSVDSVSLLLKLMNPFYPDGDENVLNTFGLADGRAAVMAQQEWPLIRADLDAGRPSPVCIVTVKSANPGDLGKNHQLLAYAYEAARHDVKLHLYDPNQPDVDDVYMKFSDGDVSQRIMVEHNIQVSGRPVYCFTRMNGAPKPIPFATKARLTAIERRARRVNIVREPTVVVSRKQVAKGRREFDVWPNCGKHEFPFTVFRETTSTRITAMTPYYRDPVLSWRINGTPISPGKDRVFIRTESDRPVDAPERPPQPDEGTGIKVTPPGMVAVNTALDGNALVIVNDPEDGSYTLVVQVTARDGSDVSSSSSRTTVVEVDGFREVVDGLEDASAECWKKYLQQHQREPGKVGAVAAALYAQLRRPGDPLWDPDPEMTGIGVKVALDDPTIAAVGEWQQDLTHRVRPNPFNPGGVLIDEGAAMNPRGATIHPSDIATRIREQLSSIPTKFGH
jgi:hypothetical protein